MDARSSMRPDRRAPRSGRIVSIIVGILVMVGGVFAVGYGIDEVQLCQQLANGMKADANVLESSVATRTGSKGRKYHRVVVRFEYQYNGRRYESHTPLVDTYESSRFAEASRVAGAFAAGSAQTAYFLPNQPERAVLDPRVTREVVIPILGGAGAIGVGFLLAMLGGGGRSYPDPELPVNTARTDDGFVVRPSNGARLSALMAGFIGNIAITVAGMLSLPDWPQEPSALMVLFTVAACILHPVCWWLGVRLLGHENSGALAIDHREGELRINALRKHARPVFRVPLTRVTDVRLAFMAGKNSRDPSRAESNFIIHIRYVRDDGVEKVRKLGGHMFKRDDAAELEVWLRHTLALDLTPRGQPAS